MYLERLSWRKCPRIPKTFGSPGKPSAAAVCESLLYLKFLVQFQDKPILTKQAEKVLLFPTVYLSEQGFSGLTMSVTKMWDRWSPQHDSMCSVHQHKPRLKLQ